MPLFSTFDLGLKKEKYDFFVQKFGVDKVLLIDRDFLFALFYIFLPALGYFVLIGGVLWLSLILSSNTGLLYAIGIPVSVIIFLTMVFRVGKVYLDYVLDFTIITPEEIISYNQTGILKRRIRTLDTEKIKTASVDKSGLLFSIFNIGNIVFFAEGDQAGGAGEINLFRVKKPEEMKRKVLRIVDIAQRMNTPPNP